MAKLKFSYGTMNCGKSTLALQMEYNLRGAGKRGKLLTRLDRGGSVVSSRLGLSRPAISVEPDENLWELIEGEELDFLIVDEVQFFTPTQIDQLGEIVDLKGIEVYCFGIASDFTSSLFDGSKRLFEIADQCEEMQVKGLCWCGSDGKVNARVVNGKLVREGAQVVVGDTAADHEIHYTLLCRPHFRQGALG